MRVPGATLQKQQENTGAEFELAKSVLNVGTAVAAGLNAGMSGQTTADTGELAAQGLETGSAQDAGGFDLSKFTEEAVDTLGGVQGMLRGDVASQNVAGNIVNNYQKGVQIGNAHAKQQGQAVITEGEAAAEMSSSSDIASQNYKGLADRAYSAQTDSLNKALNDPNTTPAVKANIQNYLQSELARATFYKKYAVKEANAIAKKTADVAQVKLNTLIETGNQELVNSFLEENNGVTNSWSPEQLEVINNKVIENNHKNRLASSQTLTDLKENSAEVLSDENLTPMKATKAKQSAITTETKDTLSRSADDAGFENKVTAALEDGIFRNKKEAQAFINNNKYSNGPDINRDTFRDMSNGLVNAKDQDTALAIENQMEQAMAGAKPAEKAYMEKELREAKKSREHRSNADVRKLDTYISSINGRYGIDDEYMEDRDNVLVTTPDAWYNPFDGDELERETDDRLVTRNKALDELLRQSNELAGQNELNKAIELYDEGVQAIQLEYNGPIVLNEWQKLYVPELTESRELYGTPGQVKEAQKFKTRNLLNLHSLVLKKRAAEKAAELEERREQAERDAFRSSFKMTNPVTGRPF
jgi:hypothetical protein